MGLLDGLFSGQSGGGLLDFLRNNAMNQQFGSGLQSDQAQYGAPMGAMAQMPQAPSAPMPQAAPPQQPQAPQQPQEPGFGDRLMAGFQNFANARGPLQALAGGVQGLATGNAQSNQTAQFLVSKGIAPELAKTIVSDPVMLRAVLPQVMGMGGQTDDIKEYQFAKQEDPSLTFEKFMARKKSVTGEFGLTPIWGTGPDGKPAYIQPGKSGEARLAALPKGFEIARDPIKVDAGTHWVLLDPQTRQPVGNVPKNLEGKESAEERGKAQGIAQAALPAVEMTAKTTIDQIDKFMESKGFNEVFGAVDQFRPNWTMSGDGRDALARFKQLSGRAFLEGRSMLKGGGAITDFESNKAESAIARLDRSQNEADAKAALEDFKSAVREGAAKLKATAGGAAPAPSSPQPSGGLPSGWSVKVR